MLRYTNEGGKEDKKGIRGKNGEGREETKNEEKGGIKGKMVRGKRKSR